VHQTAVTPAEPGALEQLRATLRTEMPITQHLGVEVLAFERGELRLSAPLSANLNHKGTAFAGSLNAIATLAGWGLVWLLLRRHGVDAHVVIQDSTVHYLRPVSGDFTASAAMPVAEAEHRLLEAVRRRGRGRVTLEVLVSDAGGPAVRFSGRYVAQRG